MPTICAEKPDLGGKPASRLQHQKGIAAVLTQGIAAVLTQSEAGFARSQQAALEVEEVLGATTKLTVQSETPQADGRREPALRTASCQQIPRGNAKAWGG